MGLIDAIIGRDVIMRPEIQTVIHNDIKMFEINKGCLQIETSSNTKVNNHKHNIISSDTYQTLTSNIGKISDDRKAKFLECFKNNYYFNEKPSKPVTDYQMTITLKKEEPFHFKPRRLSYDQKNKVNGKIQELLKEGIIRESNSPYASPIVLIPKKR